MVKSSEEKLERSLATTETKFKTSLATSERKLQRSLATSENKLQASLAVQQEKKQQENKATVMAIKNDISLKVAASERKISASERNILDISTQQSTLSLHQQILEKVMRTRKLSLNFDFTLIEFKSKKRITLTGIHLLSTPTLMATECASTCVPMAMGMEREHISQCMPT